MFDGEITFVWQHSSSLGQLTLAAHLLDESSGYRYQTEM
jgi:hypothetical protein